MAGINGLIKLLLALIAGLIAITIHEFPKAIVARSLGDETSKVNGRFTLNPFKHMDPIGFIMLIAYQVGWSYPVEFNPNNFKNRRAGTIIVSISGIIANILFAVILTVLLKFLSNPFYLDMLGEHVGFFIEQLRFYSVSLAVFNLLPIPPLSISKIISVLSPRHYFKMVQYEHLIHMGFFMLFFIQVLPVVVLTISNYLLWLLQLIVG